VARRTLRAGPAIILIVLILLAALCSPSTLFAQGATSNPEPPAAAPGPAPPLPGQNPLTVPGLPAPADERRLGPERGIRVDVDLALINVTITDPYNRLVTGLEAENFRIFEDNIEQEVAHFSNEDVPVSIGVIFDLSGSMANKVDKSRLAALQFFKTANPQDEFFLVSFNDRAQLVSPFTMSIEDLQTRLMYTAAHGRTAMLDAIYMGLSQMRGARNTKRALLIISDGGDNHSRYSERDVRNFVKEADVQVYAIGIYDPSGSRSTTEEQGGPTLLGDMTDMTGGRTFPVANLNDLPDIAIKISMELRNQYVLGFRPSNRQHDGKWRKLKIKLRPPKGLPPLNVYAKSGYLAPSR
jgi:Ca-activated chloride channel family protein